MELNDMVIVGSKSLLVRGGRRSSPKLCNVCGILLYIAGSHALRNERFLRKDVRGSCWSVPFRRGSPGSKRSVSSCVPALQQP